MAVNLHSELREAVAWNNVDYAERLIAAGADMTISKKEWFGTSPLHIARSVEMVRLLLKHGAEVNGLTLDKETPLSHAVRSCVYYTVEDDAVMELLENGANVNREDLLGNTPLHYAVLHLRPNLHIIKELVKRGASVTSYNHRHHTPLHCANTESAKVIVKYGLLRDLECVPYVAASDSCSVGRYWEACSAELCGSVGHYWECCATEIKALMSFKIVEGYSLYKFIKEDGVNRIMNCTQNVNFIQSSESGYFKQQFPIYEDDIKKQIVAGRKRENLVNIFEILDIRAEMNMCESSHSSKEIILDTHCKRMLVKYLSNDDVRNFVKAAAGYYSSDIILPTAAPLDESDTLKFSRYPKKPRLV